MNASKQESTTRGGNAKGEQSLQLDQRTAKLLRTAPTLAQQVRKDAAVAARIDAKTEDLERAYGLEREIDRAIESRQMTRTQLADRLGVNRSSISRDLNRGLSHATIARITQVVEAIDFEFLPVVIPKHGKNERIEYFARILNAAGISIADLQRSARAARPRRKKAAA